MFKTQFLHEQCFTNDRRETCVMVIVRLLKKRELETVGGAPVRPTYLAAERKEQLVTLRKASSEM